VSLVVVVPTRGRRKMCEQLLESFRECTDDADLLFITDPDDRETYEGMDWKGAEYGELSPRAPLSGKLNHAADLLADTYDAMMFCGDDHIFRTPHWDTIMLGVLAGMGGTGMVYPDDKRRIDIPEIVMISSDVVKTLGFFAVPDMSHYYLDNAWGELGMRSGILRYCPDVIVEHLHYQVHPETARDETYQSTEATWGASDTEAFTKWRANSMSAQVSLLRRTFNPDVKWVREAF
jgi:hypothetical protein